MARLSPSSLPFLGSGIGYRRDLAGFVHARGATIDFFEVMPEHVFQGSADARERLLAATRGKPVVTHSVSLSVGTATGADIPFAGKMDAINQRLSAPWCSDHLSFTRIGDRNIGQLTPLPYTDETLRVVVANVKAIQDQVHVPFLLENISQYFQFRGADMTEPEFFQEVVGRTGCGVLLDLTNLRNNAANLGIDRRSYLDHFPLEQVVQLHVAGSEWVDGKLLDTHGAPVHKEVWAMAKDVVENHPVRALLLERDQAFGPAAQLANELRRGQMVMRRASGAA